MGERWRMYERHPWLLDLNMARMPIGPHVLDADEALYAAVFRAGLRGTDVVSTTNLIIWQLLGAARSQIIESDEARRTGTSAEAYWESRASFWETYFDYQRYPDHGRRLGGRRLRRRPGVRLRPSAGPAARRTGGESRPAR